MLSLGIFGNHTIDSGQISGLSRSTQWEFHPNMSRVWEPKKHTVTGSTLACPRCDVLKARPSWRWRLPGEYQGLIARADADTKLADWSCISTKGLWQATPWHNTATFFPFFPQLLLHINYELLASQSAVELFADHLHVNSIFVATRQPGRSISSTNDSKRTPFLNIYLCLY